MLNLDIFTKREKSVHAKKKFSNSKKRKISLLENLFQNVALWTKFLAFIALNFKCNARLKVERNLLGYF